MKAPLYSSGKPLSFRCVYHHRIGPPAGETPAEAVEGAVLAIVEAWNTLIPTRRVRILNDVRFDMVRAALYQFAEGDIIRAVTHYSKQAWQRKNQYQLFDNFFYSPPPRNAPLLTWWEAAMSAAEKAEEKRPPVKAVRDLSERIVREVRNEDGWARRKQAFFSLPETEQATLRAKSAVALRTIRPKAVIAEADVWKYAIATMKI